jgi:hypothetical protein
MAGLACGTAPFDEEEQMQRRIILLAVLAVVLAGLTSAAWAKGQAATAAPAAQAGAIAAAPTAERFDPVAATNAYLAKVPPDKRAKSDAYFEGGYCLILWNFLLSSSTSTGWQHKPLAIGWAIN